MLPLNKEIARLHDKILFGLGDIAVARGDLID